MSHFYDSAGLTLVALTLGVACSSSGNNAPSAPVDGASGGASAASAGTASGAAPTMTATGAASGESSGGSGSQPTPPAPPPSCDYDAALGAPPPAFTTSCASCHGPRGEGKGVYPPIRGGLPDLVTVVRSGRISTTLTLTTAEGHTIPAQMPAFSAGHLGEADLADIVQYLKTPLNPAAPAAAYCLSRPEASWTPEQVDEAYQRGLKAWRTAGSVDNNACVFCHGPDAIEFAAIGYSDAQIYRRAFSHVSQQIADDVVDMVHALRARYSITNPPDPAVYRPFQPGGEVLPGATAAERDSAFGQELQGMGLTLMGPPINSAVEAHKAWDELKGLNLRTLKVGIPMNHYTEDIFNNAGATPTCPDAHQCDDHGTIADWISDVPVLDADSAAKIFSLHDTYLADPTLENLKQVLLAAPRDDVMWFKNKYLAVQMANYLFRQQVSGMPMLDTLPNTPFPVENGTLFNSIWMVGANLRDFIHNVGKELPTGGGKFSVPQATLAGLTRNDASEQLQRAIVPWFWLGFSFDPSTMNVEADYVAEADEYFTQQTFLDSGSSPIHAAFIVSKRSLEMMAYEQLPRSPNVFPFFHPDLGRYPVTPLSMRSGYFPVLTNFAEEKNFNTINNYQLDKMPTEPTQRALFQTYTANMYRMFMWVLIDELQQTPQIWNPKILEGKIHKAELFLTSAKVDNPNLTQDTAMLAQARSLTAAATVMK
jgi:mono/diheme cytochrome c family protein